MDTAASAGMGWTNLANLSVFMVNDNQLSGTIPTSLFDASENTFVKYVPSSQNRSIIF